MHFIDADIRQLSIAWASLQRIRRGYLERPRTGQCDPESQLEQTDPKCAPEGLEVPGFADVRVI